MTQTTDINTDRIRHAVCPEWCMGHNTELFQPWHDSSDGGQLRDHADDGVSFQPVAARPHEGVTVDVVQREDAVTGVRPAKVGLHVSCPDLTPAEARRIAALLLAAATKAEVTPA